MFFSSAGRKKTAVEKPPAPAPAPVVKPKPPEPEAVTIVPTVGTLRITSEPNGATVLLNNQERGITPLEISEVPFGKYSLLLKLKGYEDQKQDVEINAETATLDLPVTFEKAAPAVGTLVIESSPDGAFIVMSNKVVGVTPKTLPNTKAGKYNITLKKDGYQDFTGQVRVKQDQTAKMTANLAIIPKVVVAPPPEPVKPKEPELRPGTLVALGPGVTPPKSVKKTFPKYPESAKKLRLQGTVGLSLLITETGKVAEVKVTRSAHSILDTAAMEAVKTWIYDPARKNGVVVKVWLPVSISFQTGH
jgi:TonB family protein